MVTIITGIIGVATAIIIMLLIRKDHLHVRYGLWWMAAAVAFAVLGLFPGIVDSIARWLGVAYPPVLALILGLTVLVLKILVMDIERSRNAVRMQRLIQRVALLESELRNARSPETYDTAESLAGNTEQQERVDES